MVFIKRIHLSVSNFLQEGFMCPEFFQQRFVHQPLNIFSKVVSSWIRSFTFTGLLSTFRFTRIDTLQNAESSEVCKGQLEYMLVFFSFRPYGIKANFNLLIYHTPDKFPHRSKNLLLPHFGPSVGYFFFGYWKLPVTLCNKKIKE